MPYKLRRIFIGLIIASSVSGALLFVEANFHPTAIQGLYFQQWSSEAMMQTVSIEDLKNEPIQTLWHIHIQPPLFDTIRALLAHIFGIEDAIATLRLVDYYLYTLWASVYGMIVFLIFWWLSEITNTIFSAASALLFAAHPAFIFYATLLDTTLLSSFLILYFCYLLWRIKEGRIVSSGALAISFLTLYFTRSVFQWHWLLILPFFLRLLKYPLRKTIVFMVIVSLVVSLYTLKQISLFGISTTSSFTGLNLCKSLGATYANIYYHPAAAPPEKSSAELPSVLYRVKKIDGSINFNNMHYLKINDKLKQKYFHLLRSYPFLKIAFTILNNLYIYFQPSSCYASRFSNIIVDRIPWRSAYDFFASFPVLPLLLMLSCLFWVNSAEKSDLIKAFGLILPVGCIALICVFFEQGENMRFKFFIEPVLFCFIMFQTYATLKKLAQGKLSGLLSYRMKRSP